MLAELLRRSAWLATGSVLGRVLPLLVLLASSRSLDAAGYATVSAAFAWIGVSTSLSTTGLATVLAQQLGPIESRVAQRAVLRQFVLRSAAASGLLGLLVAAAGDKAAATLFGAAIDPRVTLPAAVAGALWSQVSLAIAALNGSHQPRAAAATLAVCGLLQGVPMALALAWGLAPMAMAWCTAAGSVAGAGLAAWQLQRCFGPGLLAAPPADHGAPSPRDGSAVWQSVAAAVVIPAGFLASALVARGLDGPRQLALYFLLEQVFAVVTYGPALLGQALMPMISRRTAALRSASMGALADATLRRIVIAALLLGIAGVLLAWVLTLRVDAFAAWLQHGVLRPGDAWACRWMLASAALVACTALLGGAMQGRGDLALAAQLNIAWCAMFLGTTWALADLGTTGLQFARFAAMSLLAVVTAGILLRQARVGA